MNVIRQARPLFISVLSLAAVLLGALEHESLLFQPELEFVVSQTGGEVAPDSESHGGTARFEAYPHESGTEGTFRSESHSLGVLHGLKVAQVQRQFDRSSPGGERATRLPPRRPDRTLTMGVLALRL